MFPDFQKKGVDGPDTLTKETPYFVQDDMAREAPQLRPDVMTREIPHIGPNAMLRESTQRPDVKPKKLSKEEAREKRKKKKKANLLKQAKAFNKLQRRLQERSPNIDFQQRPPPLINEAGGPQVPRYYDTTDYANIQNAPRHPLPSNQILPINPNPVPTASPQGQPSSFNAQSAWRRAGIVSQMVAQPVLASRKITLEISDPTNPDGETETYESEMV